MKFSQKPVTQQIRSCKNIANTIVAGVLLVSSTSAFALKDDTNQPINITSAQQSLDMNGNVVTFTGDVIVKQGTIDIRADKVVVTRAEGADGKEVVEAFGNPVTFYQMQDSGKPVKGHGAKLRYELANDFVDLTGDAYLEQLDSNVKGDRITYKVKEQKMEAFSNKGRRVTTILVPSQLQKK